MPRRKLALIFWSALLCWAAAVVWMSSLSPRQLPDTALLFGDKFSHFVVYSLGGWLAASSLRVAHPSAPVARQIVLAVVIVAVFGAIDESVQTFTPGRTGGDVFDWIADLVGAVAGASLCLATHVRLERRVLTRSPR